LLQSKGADQFGIPCKSLSSSCWRNYQTEKTGFRRLLHCFL